MRTDRPALRKRESDESPSEARGEQFPQEPDSTSRRCPFCGGPVLRKRPAVYCDVKHARYAAAQKARETGKRNRAWAKVMARIHERARTRGHWRELALGHEPDTHLAAIFGTTPGDPAAVRDPAND